MNVPADLAPGLHVVLGTGQVGVPVTQVLRDHGADVRVVNRSGTLPAAIEIEATADAEDGATPQGSIEAVGADVADPAAAATACAGASVVYFCLNPPYDRWPELFPPLLSGAIEGAAQAGARFVMADNLYAYGPVDGPIHEDLPAAATGEKGRTRARMAERVLEAHDAGSIDATIGRASDFYGPGVTASIVGERFFPAILSGSTVRFPGDPDLPHTYTYIEDFARALVTLGGHDEATGEIWHVPSAETLTTRAFGELAADVAGTTPTIRSTPSWLLRLLGIVVPTIRELREVRYQVTDPFVVSHEKFAGTFDLEPTPHREAIERTLAWYRTER